MHGLMDDQKCLCSVVVCSINNLLNCLECEVCSQRVR